MPICRSSGAFVMWVIECYIHQAPPEPIRTVDKNEL
jgi:hypothetical protein